MTGREDIQMESRRPVIRHSYPELADIRTAITFLQLKNIDAIASLSRERIVIGSTLNVIAEESKSQEYLRFVALLSQFKREPTLSNAREIMA
jgi:hypothetical protein